ncbi:MULTISPECIES: DUF6603 domain-containing protein [Burkholderiales]|uniref:DUF6603 domain-containing protein n=1 Tax=Burkholderiales TaxID=80840 RepID=UPI0020748C0C|nr:MULTISPECIES: DUF6603 domain-containing protein [Burkholderiales]
MTELDPPIASIATALGILDDAGRLSAAFFDHPLESVAACCTQARRRKPLLDAIDALLARDDIVQTTAPVGDPRAYLLADLAPHALALGIWLGADSGAVEATVGLLAHVELDAASKASLDIEVPLVKCSGDGLRAVCGQPGGPVRLSLRYPFDATASLRVDVAADTSGGHIGLRLDGLVVDGLALPPLEIRTDSLAGDLAALVVQLLGVMARLAGAGSAAAQVLTHLPGALGLDPAIPPLSFSALGQSAGTFSAWVAQLARGDATALLAWVRHLAGLAQLDVTTSASGAPTPEQPWSIAIAPSSPSLVLEVSLDATAGQARTLQLALRIGLDIPSPVAATLALRSVLVRLPLDGTAPPTWFTTSSALLSLPPLGNNVPLVAPRGGFGVGRLVGGVVVERAGGRIGVRPELALESVLVENRAYARLDLTSADTLAAAASNALSDAIDTLLGTTGFAQDLLVLMGLRSAGGAPTIDMALLATAPMRAIGEFHRHRLESGDWAAPMESLARLFGVAAPVVETPGNGVWQVVIAQDAGFALRLVAALGAADSGGARSFDLRVEAQTLGRVVGGAVEESAVQVRLAGTVLRIDFGGNGAIAAAGWPALEASIDFGAFGVGAWSCAGASLDLVWQAGATPRIAARFRDATLTFDDEGADGEPLQLGTLQWPPVVSTPQLFAGLGLDLAAVPPETVQRFARWALESLSTGADTGWSSLVRALAEAAPALFESSPTLQDMLLDLPSVISTVARLACAPRENGPLVADLMAAAVGGDSAAMPGTGRAGDPWLWQVDHAVNGVGLGLWLGFDKPSADEPLALQTDAAAAPGASGSAADFAWLEDALKTSPELAALAAEGDSTRLADALSAISTWTTETGGLWPRGATTPEASWGPAIVAGGTATDLSPFADAAAVDAAALAIGAWVDSGACPVLVAPAWWPPASWLPLMRALDTTSFDWQLVDLRLDALGAVAGIEAAGAYVVVAATQSGVPLADDQLNAVLTRVAQTKGPLALLAAATSFEPAVRWAASQAPGVIAGVAAVTAPVGLAGSPLDLADADLGEAVRFAQGVFSNASAETATPWADLATAWREVVDGGGVPTAGRPWRVGRLTLDALAASAAAVAATLPATVPRLAVTVVRAGRDDDEAGGTSNDSAGFAQALFEQAEALRPPRRDAERLLHSLVLPLRLSAPTTDLRATGSLFIDLGSLRLTSDEDAPPRLRALLQIDGASGWLAGPPSYVLQIAVRRLTIECTADLDERSFASASAASATARVVLSDVSVGGVWHRRRERGDAGFDAALGAVIAALDGAARGGDAHAVEVLALLRDLLGIVRPANGRHNVDMDGLAELVLRPAPWLANHLQARLQEGGVLGLRPDTAAPTGVARWRASPATGLECSVQRLPSGAWGLTVATVPAGLPLGKAGRLHFKVACGAGAVGPSGWQAELPGAHLAFSAGQYTLQLGNTPAFALWPLSSQADAEAAAGRLRPHVDAALGSGLLSALAAQVLPDAPPIAALLPLSRDPAATLRERLLSPGALELLVGTIAGWLGRPTSAGRTPLVDGVLDIVVAALADGVRLEAATGAGGWSPAAGLRVELGAGLALTPRGAKPSGRLVLGIDLPAAVQQAWQRLDLALAVDAGGLRVTATPTPGTPIELFPHFSGWSALVDAAIDRLLPAVLNALCDALPAGPLRQDALALARAAGIYGTSFSDGPLPLRALTGEAIAARAAEVGNAVAQLLATATNTSLGGGVGPVQVVAGVDGPGLVLSGIAGGTATVTALLAAPGLRIDVGGLAAGPVGLGLSFEARATTSGLQASGDIRLDLDLAQSLRIVPAPRLRTRLDTAGTVSVELYPLGETAAADARIVLAPQPDLRFTAAGRSEIARRWLLVPGLDLLVRLLDGVLDEPLGDGNAPTTMRVLLTSAGILSGGHVVVPLPDPMSMLAGAAGAFASDLSLSLGHEIDLRLLADGTRLGVALSGRVALPGGPVRTALLFGSAGQGGIELAVLRRDASGWKVQPGLVFTGVGLGLSRDGGLVSSPLKLNEVRAILGVGVDFDLATGHVTGTALTGALALTGLGLPQQNGGSANNAVASSLLGDSARQGAPVNPPLDLRVAWDGQALSIAFGDGQPGESFWIDVGRTFGPLHIERVGLQSGRDTFNVNGTATPADYIGLAIDGGLVAGPLTIAVQGLAMRLPPQYATLPSTWKVDLDGLAVDFRNDAVSIAGALAKAQVVDSSGTPILVNGQPVYEYRGLLQVLAYGFGATALGAYAQVPRPGGGTFASLFMFAAVSAPIGGPPFMFVTGVAGGFGWNRDLVPPTAPEAVPAFPLVAAMGAAGASAVDIVKQMGPSLPPREGAMWLAAGMTFSTFELLKTRALAFVKVAPQGFEIGVLGLMNAPLPSAAFTIAQVELGLLAHYSSVDQVLRVQAQLTRNSWLFTRDCRLTGGFAFVIWFQRPLAVMTVGGYGPLFQPPAHYPVVAPVGFQWRYSSNIVVKGGAYFAVTPEAAMAGGRLEVSFTADWGRASLVMYADALLWFHPPRFVLNTGFRVYGTALGFDFDVSADVYLELPPVYARVTVHVLWGVEFEIGARPAPPAFLELDEFVARYVDSGAAPKPHALRVSAGGGRSAATDTPDGTPGRPFKVLPEFEIQLDSKLPLRTVELAGPQGFSSTGDRSLYAVAMGPHVALDPVLIIDILAQRADGSFERLADAQRGALEVDVVRTGIAAAVWASTPGSGTVGELAPPQPVGGDMAQAPAGLRIAAIANVATPAGLGPIGVGRIVSEAPARPLPLDGVAATSLLPAPAAPTLPAIAPALRRPVLSTPPRLRWSTRHAGAPAPVAQRKARTTSTLLPVGQTQLWDLVHHERSGHVAADLPTRVVAFNLVGEVVLDVVTGKGLVALPDSAAAVAAAVDERAAGARPQGWDLASTLYPITASTFLADGAVFQLPAMVVLPPGTRAADGVTAWQVARQCATLCTRIATPPQASLVVALDAGSLGATTSDVTVAVAGGRLGAPLVVGSAADARMHLIYPVLERSAPTLDVTVSADPRSWCCAGMAVHVVAVGALAQRYMADRWAPLMDTIAPATESLHVALARLAASPSRSPRPCRLRFVAPAGETVTP